MRFSSTRSGNDKVSFSRAVFQGLAPDGGLYHPDEEPDMRELFLGFDNTSSFVDIAAAMSARLFAGEISEAEARSIAEEAFPFSPEILQLDDDIALLELFHGPSCAFKDYGASFLATVMEHFLDRGIVDGGSAGTGARKDRAIILTATSGDTGSAVAQAFHGKKGIDVVILYPSGRVSPSQEKQLTTLGGNIHALEVRGNFDDCQRMVKEAFIDPELQRELPLTSANSINLGRLLPQSFYYAHAFAMQKNRGDGEFYFTVPSGNFGNLTAGIFAWRWGLPVSGFIAATNANDVVPEYLSQGQFTPRPSVHTYANAMDVGNPSNFERLQTIFHSDLERMRMMISGSVVSDGEILATMKRYLDDRGVFLCPHTVTGVLASERFRAGELKGDGQIVTLATAHPAKFNEISMKASGREAPMPRRLQECLVREKQAELIGNSLEDLRKFLKDRLA